MAIDSVRGVLSVAAPAGARFYQRIVLSQFMLRVLHGTAPPKPDLPMEWGDDS